MEFPSRTNTAIIFFLIVNIMSPFFVIAQNPEIELRLRKELFTNHSNIILPVTNISQPVEINGVLKLFAINNFDTIQGILVTQCSLELSWYDEFLSWDPGEYSNISMLYVSAREIWKPNVMVCNSVAAQFIDTDVSNLVLHSDGRVVLWYQEILRTFCTIDAFGYPFDTQRCNILICVAIQKTRHTSIRQLRYRKAGFYKNFQWDVHMEGIGTSEDNSGRSLAKATLFLSRKINISTIAMIVPSAIFTVVSVFVFLLPVESGEKVSLATTLFLSVIVYLIEVDKLTPKNSESVPLLTLYLLTLTTLSGFNTIGTIMECRVYIIQKRKEDREKDLLSSDNKGVESTSKKNKGKEEDDIDKDSNQNVENEIDVPELGEESQPINVVNYKLDKPRHQVLGSVFFVISVMTIISSIITICLTKVLLKE